MGLVGSAVRLAVGPHANLGFRLRATRWAYAREGTAGMALPRKQKILEFHWEVSWFGEEET